MTLQSRQQCGVVVNGIPYCVRPYAARMAAAALCLTLMKTRKTIHRRRCPARRRRQPQSASYRTACIVPRIAKWMPDGVCGGGSSAVAGLHPSRPSVGEAKRMTGKFALERFRRWPSQLLLAGWLAGWLAGTSWGCSDDDAGRRVADDGNDADLAESLNWNVPWCCCCLLNGWMEVHLKGKFKWVVMVKNRANGAKVLRKRVDNLANEK